MLNNKVGREVLVKYKDQNPMILTSMVLVKTGTENLVCPSKKGVYRRIVTLATHYHMHGIRKHQ